MKESLGIGPRYTVQIDPTSCGRDGDREGLAVRASKGIYVLVRVWSHHVLDMVCINARFGVFRLLPQLCKGSRVGYVHL